MLKHRKRKKYDMKKRMSYEIRQMWLDFFKSKGHDIIPSASLIPVNDNTLLWINAGVAPLKKYFDGREIPANRRMANAQKSIRTNDIENVGKTARHHTFFEMLGNFSIGDYFRNEALTWAMEILTSPKWFDFDIRRLYFTVHPSDQDSIRKWTELGVPSDHIIPLEGNFWEIGEGPCGPDSEIFFDRGEKYDPNHLGIRLLQEDIENDRYIEIWNIVFSQYNAEAGKPRSEYKELPSKNIDTGMGLERMACVMQETETNYETDLFMPIIKRTEEITGVSYHGQMAFKVIADHVRSVVFAVADGAMLSNEGRGYVLRRILRRAVRYGKKLGMNEPFLYRLVEVVAQIMKSYYPYLLEKVPDLSRMIRQEEEKFLLTLETGEKRLLDYIHSADQSVIPGDIAFLLYDTFGFPFELTLEVAEENGFTVDENGFQEELEKQKERARSSRSDEQSMNSQNEDMMNFREESTFVGYQELQAETEVIGIFKDGKRTEEATGSALLVFRKTPMYAEAGGQVGDIGTLTLGKDVYPLVSTAKLPNFQHASMVELGSKVIRINDKVTVSVDKDFRKQVMMNHSATHLLNESLRRIAGKHIFQQGSYVGNKNLRFDFNHYHPLSDEELLKVENLVNEKIQEGLDVVIREMLIEEAKKLNAQAVFGEKYGAVVRVVNMDFSKEFCGGTHVKNTKDIECFAILSMESKGSGIYRIEAATGNGIRAGLENVTANVIREIRELKEKARQIRLNAKEMGIELEATEIPVSIYQDSYQYVLDCHQELMLTRDLVRDLDKKFTKEKKEKTVISLDDYLHQAIALGNYQAVVAKTSDLEPDVVKDLADRLADKLGMSVVFLADVHEDRVFFVCKNRIPGLHAGNLVKQAAIIAGGNGGGRNDFAQAGGKDPEKTDSALEEIRKNIQKL